MTQPTSLTSQLPLVNDDLQPSSSILCLVLIFSSIGILGQPLKQFNPVTLIHHEEQSRNKERDKASVNDGQSER